MNFKNFLINFLWIAPFISFFLGYRILDKFFYINEIEVPSIIGKPLNEGSRILSDNNLSIRILAEKEDSDLPEGTILDQKPIKQKNKPKQPVYLVISKKPISFIIPEFRGQKFQEIQKLLKEKKISCKIYKIESNYPPDICLAQYPGPGQCPEDKKIFLYISTGNKKDILFPDLKGQDLEKVLNFLDLNNIKVSIFTTNSEQYDTKNNYIIQDQKPLAGSILKLNPNINVQLLVQEIK